MCSVTWNSAVRLVFCGSSEVGSAWRPTLRMPPRLGCPAAAAGAVVGFAAAVVGCAAAAVGCAAAAGAVVGLAAAVGAVVGAGALVGAAGVPAGPHADARSAHAMNGMSNRCMSSWSPCVERAGYYIAWSWVRLDVIGSTSSKNCRLRGVEQQALDAPVAPDPSLVGRRTIQPEVLSPNLDTSQSSQPDG